MFAVSNAELALSILGGGNSLLGASSTGAPTISALAAFKSYQKDQVAARKAFAGREDIQRDIAAFKTGAKKLTSVDDLLKDRKTLSFVLSAFGLESEIDNPGKLKAVFNSDPQDVNSFANRLTDSRFSDIAAFLNTPQFGVKNLQLSDKQGAVVDKYLETSFEKSLAAQNPAVRDALFFLRRIGTVQNSYEILSDLPLRSIVTEALHLPAVIARQSVQKQASLIDSKLNLDLFRVSGAAAAGSKSRLDLVNDDLTTLAGAAKTISSSQTVIDGIVSKLDSLRGLYSDYNNIVDPAGVNASEIPIQQAALPDLLRQRGLVAAANGAVQNTRSALNQLQSLFNQARSATDATDFADIQTSFLSVADKILGDTGYISGATYYDPNSGLNQNLLRNGTGGTLPTGIDSTPSQISTTVDSEGTKAITNSTDLASFLTDLQTVRDAVAATSFGSANTDLSAVSGTFDTAKSTFKTAETLTQIDVSSILNAFNSTTFAVELNTDSLSLGLSSLNDSLSRASSAKSLLISIKSLANEALDPNADLTDINTRYALKLSELKSAIQKPDSVTDGTTTVTLDNLLTSGTKTYTVLSGTVFQAEGGDLTTDVYNNLPATITADNADQLKTDINDTYQVTVDDLIGNLTRDQKVADFAANTLDPRGQLDAQVRQIQSDLSGLIDGAAVNGKNLLSPYSRDLTVSLGSIGSTLTIDAQTDFKDSFSSILDSFATTVLTGGTIDDRLSVLNDALFTAGRTQSRIRAEGYALNVQKSVLTSEKGTLDAGSSDNSGFLKGIEYTPEALKFIERYLVQKDLENQGVNVGTGQLSANAAVAAQIGSILPQPGGLGFNVLA